MTVGTIGFVRERLTEAREALGLTKVALAELLDVTPMAVSQYESGPQTPRPDVLDRICSKLGYQRSFFLRPTIQDEDAPIFWRSNASATKIARQRGLQRLRWIKEILAYLKGYFDFPKVSLPDFAISEANFRGLTDPQIEGFAQQCRNFWGFGTGPVPDLVLELENSGAVISRINMAAETLHAFSQWSEAHQTPFVILGKDHASAVRSRFDAAHELAHLVLHKKIERRRVNSKEDWKILEQQAHRFAAAFLLPEKPFCDELWIASLDGFAALKERWRVSIGMMIVRAQHVGITDKQETQRLFINYNRRGWREEEPLDNTIKHEMPRLLRRSFEGLVQDGVKNGDQIVADLSLPTRELEELGTVNPGFFGGPQSEVKAFPKLKTSLPAAESEAPAPSNVVSLANRRNRT